MCLTVVFVGYCGIYVGRYCCAQQHFKKQRPLYNGKIASAVSIASVPTPYATQVTSSQPLPKPFACTLALQEPESGTAFTRSSTTV